MARRLPVRLGPRTVVAALAATAAASAGWLGLAHGATPAAPASTPIQHVVVIFDENESFDHYFGTYPNAANPPGEPAFTAAPGTPSVSGLTGVLLHGNPNGADPERIDRANALTCDQDHGYADEQKAFDGGAMDKFVAFTAGGSCADRSIVMDYVDGNTVTALWNLAQHFTLSDAFFGSTFGPSTPGALNLIAGTTHGAVPATSGAIENGSLIGDEDSALDDCGSGSVQMDGRNIGDLMNAKGVTWGWFQGGFRRTSVDAGGRAACAASHANIGGAASFDYSAHHEPFMYYASTANPHHLPPSSVAAIGQTDQANHQYDLGDFDAAVRAGNLPQVSFLKAAQFEDAHPGYSDPLDEQHFVARTLDELEQSPDWGSTAVVIAYDDSDGWYDHVDAVAQGSTSASDAAVCSAAPLAPGAYQDRCGPGPRLPLLLISPYARENAVSSAPLEQASIIRFIEDNWDLGRIGDQSFDARAGSLDGLFDFSPGGSRAPKVYLDPETGEVVATPPDTTASPNGLDSTPTPTATATATASPEPTATPAAGTPTPAPTAAPTATATPAPTATPAARRTIHPRLGTPKGTRKGKTVTVTVKLSGLSARAGRISVSARLLRKSTAVATSASTKVKLGTIKLKLKGRKSVKKGAYTLSLRVTQAGARATVAKKLTLR